MIICEIYFILVAKIWKKIQQAFWLKAIYLQPVLKVLTQAFGNASQSFNHIACFDLPQYYKTLVLSDVVYQRFPEYKTKINTIFNLKRFAQSMEYDHFNIGILSSVNQPFVKISSSIDAAKLKEHFAKMNERFITVDGPITLDNAIDKNIAIQK